MQGLGITPTLHGLTSKMESPKGHSSPLRNNPFEVGKTMIGFSYTILKSIQPSMEWIASKSLHKFVELQSVFYTLNISNP
jgi:hypothetical protein